MLKNLLRRTFFYHTARLQHHHIVTHQVDNSQVMADQQIAEAIPVLQVHHQIQYLDIPLSLKMTTTEIGYITYYGEFGLLPSFRLKARSDVENFVAGVSMNKTENINSVKDINPITLALHIGLGMQYSLSESTSLLMGLYINNGFTDILHDTETIKFKANANQAGLTVGFLF